jgi:hypothetical protein
VWEYHTKECLQLQRDWEREEETQTSCKKELAGFVRHRERERERERESCVISIMKLLRATKAACRFAKYQKRCVM